MDDIEKWKRRTIKKGPYWLYTTTKLKDLFCDDSSIDETLNLYYLMWNDKDKTKFGTLRDNMYCRYGFNTLAVLNGETELDVWNGKNINRYIFEHMLKVRNGETDLPIFNIDEVKIKSW